MKKQNHRSLWFLLPLRPFVDQSVVHQSVKTFTSMDAKNHMSSDDKYYHNDKIRRNLIVF
jgi:hypothetical protein